MMFLCFTSFLLSFNSIGFRNGQFEIFVVNILIRWFRLIASLKKNKCRRNLFKTANSCLGWIYSSPSDCNPPTLITYSWWLGKRYNNSLCMSLVILTSLAISQRLWKFPPFSFLTCRLFSHSLLLLVYSFLFGFWCKMSLQIFNEAFPCLMN